MVAQSYAPVENFSFAEIFEIGRIISESEKPIYFHGLQVNGSLD